MEVENNKQFKNAKKWGMIAGLLVSILIITIGYEVVKGTYLVPNTIVSVFKDCFMDGDPYPPVNGTQIIDGDWILISVNATDEKDGLIKLKKTYNKLSAKFETNKIKKIIVSVSEYSGEEWGLTKPYKPGWFMFASEMWISDLKKTDWENINTYSEFKEKANVFDIPLN